LLVQLAESVFNYYRRIGEDKAATIVALLRVEHMYYKHDSMTAALKKSRSSGSEDSAPSTASVIESLCQFIFNNGDERTKTRALLCSVFYHALHDRYYRARDLFLISHIQDTIDKADTKTQILYNRALVTMGLSAFRMGLFQKAHDCLAVICAGRVRELLAQGPARWHDKDPEHERLERRRQMPYHMHINPDLLECCHFTAAMFLEMPNLCRQNASPTAPNAVSRPFRKYLLSYSRQVFTGPPENIREQILVAAKALLAGDLKRASELVLNLDVWNKLPAECGVRVKEMLQVKLKEEAVKTYIVLVGMYYESLGLSHICEMFQMEPAVAKRIISKMIFNKEVSAAWETGDILVLYTSESSAIQPVAVALAEKITLLVESNERLLDSIYGSKDDFYPGDRRQGQDGRKGQQGTSSSAGPNAGNVDGQQDRRRGNMGWKSNRPQNMVRYNSNTNTVSRGGGTRGLSKNVGGQGRSWGGQRGPGQGRGHQDGSRSSGGQGSNAGGEGREGRGYEGRSHEGRGHDGGREGARKGWGNVDKKM
jgi:translation initiation factor 3 subunit C